MLQFKFQNFRSNFRTTYVCKFLQALTKLQTLRYWIKNQQITGLMDHMICTAEHSKINHNCLLQLYIYTVEFVYHGHLGTSQKCPDYQGVLIFQVSLHDNVSFGTTAIGVWIMQVSTFSSVVINRFHCIANGT